MSGLRVLACADLHLGRSSSILGDPEQAADLSAVGAWKRIVQLAVSSRADAVLIAGDVFDRLPEMYASRRAFLEGVRELTRAGIATVAIAGNHDHDSLPIALESDPTCGLRLLGQRDQWNSVLIETGSGPLQVVGWSFPQAQYRQDPVGHFALVPSTNVPTVGLVHGEFVSSSPYAPLQKATMARHSGVHAWVIGHIHKPEIPVDGLRHAIVPGSPQSLDFGPGEMGRHGAVWLKLDAAGLTSTEFVPISSIEYREVVVDAEGEQQDVLRILESQILAMRAEARSLNPHLSALQLRIRLRWKNAPGDVKLEKLTEPNSDGWEISAVELITNRSVWDYTTHRGLPGHVARLLVGISAVNGRYENRAVDPDWIAHAAAMADSALPKVREIQNKLLSDHIDPSDELNSAPTEDQCRALTAQLLRTKLEEKLRGFELALEAKS